MTPRPDGTRDLVVKVLLRDVPFEIANGDAILEVYKAVVESLKHKYAVMGYSWDRE